MTVTKAASPIAIARAAVVVAAKPRHEATRFTRLNEALGTLVKVALEEGARPYRELLDSVVFTCEEAATGIYETRKAAGFNLGDDTEEYFGYLSNNLQHLAIKAREALAATLPSQEGSGG
jgi:hypothetical protein